MKLKYVAITTLAILFTAGITFAQPGMGRGFNGPPPEHGPMFGKMMDLTEAQQKEMSALRLEHMKQMEPIRSEIQKLRSDLNLLIVADNYSSSKAKSLVEKINGLQLKMEMARIDHLRTVRSKLTAEQKTKFDQKILAGPGKMGKRFGKGHKGMGRRMHRMDDDN